MQIIFIARSGTCFLLLEILFISRSGTCFFIIGDYCYCKVWDMVEERALQLAPPPGHSLTSILCVPFLLKCFALYSPIFSLYLCPDAPTNPKTLQAKPNLKPCTTQPPVHHPATKTLQDPCGPLCTSPPSSFSCASYLFHILLPAQSVSDLG